jgi:hypothetical protein
VRARGVALGEAPPFAGAGGEWKIPPTCSQTWCSYGLGRCADRGGGAIAAEKPTSSSRKAMARRSPPPFRLKVLGTTIGASTRRRRALPRIGAAGRAVANDPQRRRRDEVACPQWAGAVIAPSSRPRVLRAANRYPAQNA